MRNHVNAASATAKLVGTSKAQRGRAMQVALMGSSALVGVVLALAPNAAKAQDQTYAVTGTYVAPVNAPATLTVDAGVEANQAGAISQTVAPSSIRVSGPGVLTLSNSSNDWTGTTSIDAGATLIGTTDSISGGSVIANGTLIYDQPFDATTQTITGSGQLIKREGQGSWMTLGAQSAFTGAVRVEGGKLIVSGGSLANATSITLAAGATLEGVASSSLGYNGFRNLTGAAGSQFNLGTGVAALLYGTTTFDGNISGNQLEVQDTLTLTGNNNGITGAVFAQGSANVILTGTSSLNNAMFIGNLDISGMSVTGAAVRTLAGGGGTVTLGTKTLTVLNGGANSAATIVGTGGLSIQGGQQGLYNASTFTGVTTIADGATLYLFTNGVTQGSIAASDVANGGTLKIDGGSAAVRSISGAGAVDIGSGATLVLANGQGTTFTGAVGGAGGLTLAAGTQILTGALSYAGATTIEAGTLTIGGESSIANSSSVALTGQTAALSLLNTNITLNNLQGVAGSQVSLAGKSTTTLNNSANTIFSGTLNGGFGIEIMSTLTKTGAGSLTLEGANNYSGAIRIDGGSLLLAGNGSLANASINVGGAQAFDISGVTAPSSTIISLTGDAGARVGLGAKTLVLSAATGTFAGTIGGTGATGGLTVAGGTLALSGANEYTGLTTVNNGAALVVTGSLARASGLVIDGTLTTSGLAAGYAEFANLSGAATGRIQIGGTNFFVDNGSGDFAGIIDGSGVVGVNAGTQIFSGNNTYTGATVLQGGNLTLGNGGTSGSIDNSSQINLGAGSTLTVNRSNDLTFNRAIQGEGNFVQAGSGTTTLGNGYDYNSRPVYSGTTTISNGTLRLEGWTDLSNSSAISLTSASAVLDTSSSYYYGYLRNLNGVAGSRIVTNGGLNFDNNVDTTFDGNFENADSLYKYGQAELTLTQDTGVTGQVSIYQGALALAGAGSLAQSDRVYVGNEGTFDVSGVNGSATTVGTLDGYGSVVLGATTLTLSSPHGEQFNGNISGAGGLTIALGEPYQYQDEGTGEIVIEPGNGVFRLGGENSYTGVTTINTGTTLALVSQSSGNCDCIPRARLAPATEGSIEQSSLVQVDGIFDVRTATAPAIQALAGAGSVLLGAGGLTINGESGSTVFSGVISDVAPSYVGSWLASDGPAVDTNPRAYSGLETAALLFGGTAEEYQISTNADASAINHEAWGVHIHEDGYAHNQTNDEDYSDDQGEPGVVGDYAFSTYVNAPISVADRAPAEVVEGPQYSNYAFTVAEFSQGYGITKSGASTLTLAGVNTYTGLTTISGGTLNVDGGNAIVDTNAVLVNAGGTFGLLANETIGTLTGAGNVALGASTLTVGTDGDFTFAGVASGTGGLTKVGTGVFTLAGANTYSGTTSVNAGTLRLGASNVLADNSELNVLDGATLDLNGFNETVGIFSIQGNLIGGGLLTASEYRLYGGTIDQAIGTGTLVQISGTTLLNGTAASSPVRVQGGTLRLGASERLGDSAALSVLSGATLDLQAFNETVGTAAIAGTLAGSGTLSAASYTLDGAAVNANLGTGALVQASGTSTLRGTNAVTSAAINGGTLALVDTATLGAAAVTINAGTLDISGHTGDATIGGLNGTGAVTLGANALRLGGTGSFGGVASGTGGMTVVGGTATLSGTNTYTGATTLAGGNLTLGAGGTTGSVAGTIDTGTGTLSIDRSDAATLANTITGTGTIAQIGSGVLTVSGNNAAFAGTTSVRGGGLQVTGTLGSAASALTVASTLSGTGTIGGSVTVNDGGHLVGAQGTTLTMGALALTSGALVDVTLGAPGNAALFNVAGNLVLDGTLNVTGGTGYGVGVYRLFDYGGALTDNGLATASNTLTVQTSVAGRVNLVNTTGAALSFWDGGNVALHDNNAVNGGSGTWTTTGRTWTQQDGAVNGPMTPQPSFAVFQGAGGTVTIDNGAGAVSATGMQFAVDGYTVAGAALTLSGERATIRVGDGTSAGAAYTARISAPLGGSSTLVKTDLGTLVLTGANTYSGGTVVSAGKLVGNAASIRGNLENNASTVFDQADNASFAGTVSGTGTVEKAGAGALTLAGASSSNWSVTGGTLVSTSTLFTGNLAVAQGTSFVFDQSFNGTYAGTITGAGSVSLRSGGAVQLTGNSSGFAGTTTVGGTNANLLTVNGTLGGFVDVLAGGRLQGTGTIGSGRIAGTIAPGNSIGTLTFTGNLSFAAGGIFEVEANAAGASDKIVVGGAAALAGTVSVLAADGNYAANTDYTILTAAGGITGTFGAVTSNLAFLTPSLAYATNAVTLRLARNTVAFATVAQTSNQRGVASALQGFTSGNPVYDAFVALSAPQARTAFDQLAGSDYASVRGSIVDDTHFVRDAVASRVETAGSEGLAIWGRVLGSWQDMDGNAEAASYDRSLKGFLTGFDGSFDEHWRVGVALGYGDTEFRTANAEHQAESYHAGGYLLGSYGPVTVQGGGAYAWNSVTAQRRVAFGTLGQQLGDKYDVRTFQTFGEVAVKGRFGGVELQPFAGVAHVALFDGTIAEHGGAAALHGGTQGFAVTYGSLGLRAKAGFDLGEMGVAFTGSAGVRHAFGDRVPTIDLGFATGPTFQISGIPIERDSAAVEAGLELAVSQSVTFGVSYTGSYGQRSTDHGVRAQIGMRF